MIIIDAKQNRSALVPALKTWVPDIDIESVSIYISNPFKYNSKLLTIGELLDTIEKNGKKKKKKKKNW